MVKLMIVDDEICIRTSLKNKIEWMDDLSLCAEARDGIEALQLALNLRPDIIITDVRMPEMSGIDFISRLKEFLPDVQTIFISGYNDFNYVKSALELESCAYVLKPIRKEELNAAIQKASRNLQKNNMLRFTMQLQLRLLDTFLDGFYHGAAISCAEFKETLKSLHFHTSYFHLLLIRFVESGDDAERMEQTLNTEAAILSRDDTCRILSITPSVFAVFLTSKRPVDMLAYGKSLIRQLCIKYSMDVSIVLGQTCNLVSNIPCLFQTAKDGLRLLHLYSVHEIILPSQETAPASLPPFPQELARTILDSIYTNNLPALEQTLHTFHRWIKRTPTLTLYDINRMVSQLLGDILRILYERNAPKEIIDRGISLMNHCSIECISDELTDPFSAYCRLVCTSLQHTSSIEEIIRQAQQYIQTRYNEEISLKKMASLYYLNVSYFSISFKSITGKNFNEYVTSVRMEHAKQYLSNKDIKISEAARMSGYEDISYFGKIFRKYVGMMPKEYRAAYSNAHAKQQEIKEGSIHSTACVPEGRIL